MTHGTGGEGCRDERQDSRQGGCGENFFASSVMSWLEQIQRHVACCEQEAADREMMLELFGRFGDDLLHRQCRVAHLTSSALIFSRDRAELLLVHHNIYRSWGWTGGHADGDGDLLRVALREAQEETGLVEVAPLDERILSLDVLPVHAHQKNGAHVSPHLHLSVAYALLADRHQPVRLKPGENSGVRWAATDQLGQLVSECHMMAVYQKIIEKVGKI